MSFDLQQLVRPNIEKLVPYSSARDEFSGEARVFLDANENSLGSPVRPFYNRYPDPHQKKLKQQLQAIKGIPEKNIFLGNGSDECIDILLRCFCEPGLDNVIVCPPTYGMYEVSAQINNVQVVQVPLTPQFQLDLPGLEAAISGNTKMIFLCSPNNPTGNSLDLQDILVLLNNYFGLVVLDEAYINFSRQRSLIPELTEYPNLVILQTLSKAWGLAALRIGMTFCSESIVAILNKVKPPYNIGQASQEIAGQALQQTQAVNETIREIIRERERLEQVLSTLPVVVKVFPSDANFLLVKVTQPQAIYQQLLREGIVVRDRSKAVHCEGCLRITVGAREENDLLVAALS
ncbi:MAG: histidinol-phosphate transaminase, partial [Chitinophagaceae bacterium]